MVIQRWQSVLLFIAAIAMAAFSFLSLGQVQLPEYSLNFTTMGFGVEGEVTGGLSVSYLNTWPLFIVSLMSVIIPLIDIFLFKNMRLQKTLCLIELLFLFAVITIGAVYGYSTFEGYSVSWSSLVIAPFLAIIAIVMAYSRICSDERLLRSADRLR